MILAKVEDYVLHHPDTFQYQDSVAEFYGDGVDSHNRPLLNDSRDNVDEENEESEFTAKGVVTIEAMAGIPVRVSYHGVYKNKTPVGNFVKDSAPCTPSIVSCDAGWFPFSCVGRFFDPL